MNWDLDVLLWSQEGSLNGKKKKYNRRAQEQNMKGFFILYA